MKPTIPQRRFIYLFLGGWLVNSLSVPARAQIVPDATLPNPSVVNVEGQVQRITGGTGAGGNLFHSFGEFNISTGETAFFDNAPSIDSIITRVTGGQFSNIDGILRTNGSANLFLLNPNGIAFGPNAQLNIGGSFLGSTADSLLFEDGTAFSATNPQATPLLSINVPIGLQFGVNPGSIVNRSQTIRVAEDGTETVVGLQVQPERTLALVGGDIILERGNLTAAAGSIDLEDVGGTLVDDEDGADISGQQTAGGRIEVGALGNNSRVRFDRSPQNSQIFALSYEGVENFQDVRLSELSTIDASGDGGGPIQIQGRRVTVEEGSIVRSNTLGTNPGEPLTIRATEDLEVLGNALTDDLIDPRLAGAGIIIPRRTSISTTSFASGRSGDLMVEAETLVVNLGAEIVAFSFGTGRGGNVLVRAAEAVDVSGQAIPLGFDPESLGSFGFDVPGFGEAAFRSAASGSSISATSAGAGDAGSVRIETGRLSIRDGAFISTNPLFSGQGGTLTVIASESVEVSGTSKFDIPPNNLGISQSLLWSAATGSGDAQDLTIETQRLIVRDGGTVQATTFGTGDAGNVFINASELIEVDGFGLSPRDGVLPSNISASTFGEGNAGGLSANTSRFIVRNGGQVSVNSTRGGNAGNLNAIADSIELDNRAVLNAATVSGVGGNITLETQSLQLRDRTRISTNAGNTDGGNIRIDTDTLVALENSDITANALQGRGGQVAIAARGIFGTQFRDRLTPESDITATSDLGAQFSGTVTITTPDVEAAAGLVQLSSNTTDPSDRIVSGCTPGSSFTVTGRGGIIEDPMSVIRGETVWEDWQNYAGNDATPNTSSQPIRVTPLEPVQKLVEATGWVVRDDGTVELVADRLGVPRFGGKAPQCQS